MPERNVRLMIDNPVIHAYYSSGQSSEADESVLRVRMVTEQRSEEVLEYHAEVTNCSDSEVFLESVRLWESESLQEAGVGDKPYEIFRSGRHKNDLPGVFTAGCPDERLKDVTSAVLESGEGMTEGSGTAVISDHLTMIRGSSETILAIEFLTGRDQLVQTVLQLDEAGDLKQLYAETLFRICLKPSMTVRTESIRIALIREAGKEAEQFAKRKALLYGQRNRRHPAVFCTWYYYGLTVSLEDVRTCLREIRNRKLPYEVFQVDEGWEVTLGEYEPNERFPVSMKELAAEIREAGMVPGLWSSPFVAHETASVWKKHPEWILKERDGSPCLFAMNDTVYYVFDITDSSVWEYFRELYQMFTEDWGYVYHKLDFTRAAVIFENARFHDDSITLVQAYVQAVRAIRRGMGEDAFLLMCGGLYDPLIGLVDGQRTGSDVLSMWSTDVQKGGRTVPYTVRQSILRGYMNEWWANDPDALMIRKNTRMERGLRLTLGLLNDEEVQTVLISQFAGGGMLTQTEPLDRISDERLKELCHLLPLSEKDMIMEDLLSPERFPSAVRLYDKRMKAHCICRFNWSDTEPEELRLKLSELGLAPGRYAVCDFSGGIFHLNLTPSDTAELGTLQPHGATVIRIEPMKDEPMVVASDGHYSMGRELEYLKIEDGVLTAKRINLLSTELNCTVFVPALQYNGRRGLIHLQFKADETEKCIRLEGEL